jgi:hypothetical protein
MNQRLLFIFFLLLKVNGLANNAETSDTTEPTPHVDVLSFSAKSGTPPEFRLRELPDPDPKHNKMALRFHGFPVDKDIIFSMLRLVQSDLNTFEKKGTIRIKADGMVVFNDMEVSTIFLTSRGFLPGEKVYYRFHTADDSFQHEISMIPNPLKCTSKSGRVSMEAELMDPAPALYHIQFTGIDENEECTITSFSKNEKIKHTSMISRRMGMLYSPDVRGEKGGLSKLIIQRRTGERLELRLPWGDRLFAYLEFAESS